LNEFRLFYFLLPNGQHLFYSVLLFHLVLRHNFRRQLRSWHETRVSHESDVLEQISHFVETLVGTARPSCIPLTLPIDLPWYYQ